MPDALDPLKALLVEAVVVDRERIARSLAGRLALDQQTGRTVLLPGYAELDAKGKLLALLLLRRAAGLLGLAETDAISPSEAARESGMPGGTVRRMLPELVDGHLASKGADGGYCLSNAQIPSAIALVEQSSTDSDNTTSSPTSIARKSRKHQKKAGRSGPTEKGSSSKGARSPTALVGALIDSDFFAEPRTLADVQRRLKDKSGHDIPTTSLSPVLTRLLRAERLDRNRGEGGVYEYSVRPGEP